MTILDPWHSAAGDGATDASPPVGIHHVNVLVRDLDAAVHQYQRLLGLDAPMRESLPSKDVETARFRLGDSWLVLVTPTSPDSTAARRLASHGEGLFLLSLRVRRLDDALGEARTRGAVADTAVPRPGIARWMVVDLALDSVHGLTLQLCEDQPPPRPTSGLVEPEVK
ncbi:MAG TPA: VOC family protein [Burkholderiaceae bacterium]|nr:VOC family protein [Burkholderiaceae bacterium]